MIGIKLGNVWFTESRKPVWCYAVADNEKEPHMRSHCGCCFFCPPGFARLLNKHHLYLPWLSARRGGNTLEGQLSPRTIRRLWANAKVTRYQGRPAAKVRHYYFQSSYSPNNNHCEATITTKSGESKTIQADLKWKWGICHKRRATAKRTVKSGFLWRLPWSGELEFKMSVWRDVLLRICVQK